MPHKSKPKQRTNWKQRALHCEEVIKIQGVVAESREKWVDSLSEGVKYWETRAESAEKHNALLLEERDAKIVCSICGEFCNTKLKRESFCSIECITACVGNEQKKAPPTHWQRFKSWLSGWYVELACLIVILCVTAGCVAFVYWPRG